MNNFLSSVESVNNAVNGFVWGLPMRILLVGTGILMTVLTMILGMLPLAVGSGAGAVGNRSLALAVIGGMTIGTIALLFVTPAFYMVFQKLHEKLTPEKDDE